MNAAKAVLKIKPSDGDDLDVLLSGLKDRDEKTRSRVVENIGALKLRSEKVVTALAAVAIGDKSFAGWRAAIQLGDLADSVPSVMPHLVKGLEHEDPDVRHQMVYVVRYCVKNEKRVVP